MYLCAIVDNAGNDIVYVSRKKYDTPAAAERAMYNSYSYRVNRRTRPGMRVVVYDMTSMSDRRKYAMALGLSMDN